MRKNPYYKESRCYILDSLILQTKDLDLESETKKQKINEIFRKHKKLFKVDLIREVLVIQKNRYSF